MELTRELPHQRWATYLQDATDELRHTPVVIEVTDPENGTGVEARRMALQALIYDQRADVFEVAAAHGGPHLPTTLHHLVDHPTRIEVDSLDARIPTMISVIDGDGVRTDVRIVREGAFAG